MPYEIIKVNDGYKVKKQGYDKYYSNHPMTKERATLQLRDLCASKRTLSPGRKFLKSPYRKVMSISKSPVVKRHKSPVVKRHKSPVVKRKSKNKMITKILSIRSNWSKCLRNSDLEGVLNCYSKKPIFKGTMTKVVTRTKVPLKNYFINFMKQEPKVKFNDYDIVKTGDLYIESGNYTFTTREKIINANYQFIYQEMDDEIKIISHYSCMS